MMQTQFLFNISSSTYWFQVKENTFLKLEFFLLFVTRGIKMQWGTELGKEREGGRETGR